MPRATGTRAAFALDLLIQFMDRLSVVLPSICGSSSADSFLREKSKLSFTGHLQNSRHFISHFTYISCSYRWGNRFAAD